MSVAMKLVLVAGLFAGISGCNSDPSSVLIPTPDCAQPPSASVSPPTAALRVGGTVRVVASMTPCEGLPAIPVFRFRSSDTLTASVDAITGLVRARRPGTANIVAALVGDPTVGGVMALLVAP